MRRFPAADEKPLHWVGASKRDVELVAERLKTAESDYEEHYGKPKR